MSSAPLAASREREYRILATIEVSTLEKELKEAAAVGFHAIAAGAMRVVLVPRAVLSDVEVSEGPCPDTARPAADLVAVANQLRCPIRLK